MQKLSACRKRFSEIQRRRSTSSWCMIAIWPVGPPKLMKPSFSQKRSASEKEIIRGPLMAQCRQARVPAALYRHNLNVDAVQALQGISADHLLRRADLQRAPTHAHDGAVRAQQRV